MCSKTRFRWPIPLNQIVVWRITAFAVACFAVAESPVSAADSAQVLVVPASEVTLHLAATLPDGVQLHSADAQQLVEVDQPDVVLSGQLAPAIAADGSVANDRPRLVADIPPREGASDPRRFRLEPAKAAPAAKQGRGANLGFQFKDVDQKSLELLDGDKPVLVYNHGLITNEEVPENDHRRSRACYVHPIYGLNGEVLTDDFPRDHYHHHGIFWTWPHIGIEGKEYNLWAGNDIQDKFVAWICRETGPMAAVLAVENGWFVGEQKVMIERVWLRVYKVSDDTRSLDIEFIWIPVEKPVTLWGAGGKSYGGMTMRFAVGDSKRTTITVPSGRTTEDLKETRLAWADLTYPFPGAPGSSGAAVFVHPGHPDYAPTWLTRHYGILCVGWPGVKPKTFEPGKPIRLGYRVWIHKTAVEPDELKQAYEGYTAAARVTWE